jgi:Spy/CpxP family protein refolding chaperone
MRQKMAAAGVDPDARRAALRDGMHALSDILTPEQKAKLAQLRASTRGGGAGSGGGAPAAPSPAPTAPAAPAASAPPPPTASPPASAAAASGGRGDRMARLTEFLGLDADQQAKAKAIFAAGSGAEAFAKFRAILRPDQQAKLDARRAQRQARQSGGGNP